MRLKSNATPEQQKIANEFWVNMKSRNKPVQASQQALPVQQPMQTVPSPADQLNSFMQNEYMPTITKDTQLQQMKARQQELSSTIKQNRTSFLNSLGLGGYSFQNPYPDPAFANFMTAGLNAWVNSQPEYRQIQQISQQSEEYIQQTYPELATKQRTLSDIARFGFNPQAQPIQAREKFSQAQQQQQQINAANANQRAMQNRFAQQQPTQESMQQVAQQQLNRNQFNYLPKGLTQEEFNKQARINMTQEYKTPEQMASIMKSFYDTYKKENAGAAVPKVGTFVPENKSNVATALPIPANPMDQFTLPQSTKQFTPGNKPMGNLNFKNIQETPKKIEPIVPKPDQLTADPIKPVMTTPKKPKGLGNRTINSAAPMAYQSLNTNINR